jgi:hypothetical protein
MASSLKRVVNDLLTGVVIAIRRKRPQQTETSTSHSNPATADSPENVSRSRSRRFEAVSDAAEFVFPLVGAAAGAIPVAGPPLKAAVDVLLYVIQTTNVGHLFHRTASPLITSQTKNRNKAALDDLASRIRQLSDFLSQEPQARDEAEAERRADLTK